MNLGASCWLISWTQLLKPFKRATQAGDGETAEINALPRRSGGQWSTRKVCIQKTTLAFVRASTFTFKHLSCLSEILQNNTERSIFVTNELNPLNCYMEELVITNIKYKYKAYLLTERTNSLQCELKGMFCKPFSYVIVKAKNGENYFSLHNKQWPLLAQWKNDGQSFVPWGGPLFGFPFIAAQGVLSSALSGVSSIQNLNASLYQELLAELMRLLKLPGLASSPWFFYFSLSRATATLTFLRGFLGAPHSPRSSYLRI